MPTMDSFSKLEARASGAPSPPLSAKQCQPDTRPPSGGGVLPSASCKPFRAAF